MDTHAHRRGTTATDTRTRGPVRPPERLRPAVDPSAHEPLLRVLVCDRQPILREAICGLLRNETNMDVVGSTASGTQALGLARTTHAQVVVIGTGLMDRSGLELIDGLRRETDEPAPCVIAFALGTDDSFLTKIIHAGVNGVLAEEATHYELVAAINAGIAGYTTLAPPLAQRLVEWFRQHNGQFEERLHAAADCLTRREREVLQLIACGRTMEEVAGDLFIEMTTVRTHVYRMRAKLGIADRAQLVSFAFRAGLLPAS